LFFASNFPNCEGIIAANTKMQLSDSTLKRVFETWKSKKIEKFNPKTGKGDYVVNTQPPEGWTSKVFPEWSNKICLSNGAIIFTGSLDNYAAHDGKEVAWILLDETKDTKQEALTEVLLARCRQQGLYINSKGELTSDDTGTPFNPTYLFTSPAKVQWLNSYFNLFEFEKEIRALIFSETTFFARVTDKDKFVSISSTYLNKWISPGYIPKQKASLPPELQEMNIYGCPFSRAGGEFYKQFERQKHVGKCPYNADLPLHVTFDFNVTPYVTLNVWQIDGKKAMQIDEICAKYPHNSTAGACGIFRKKYPAHKSGLFIYGDPSGNSRDTRGESGRNDFDIIRGELKQYNPIMKVGNIAPNVVARGQFINMIFHNQYQGISILIDEQCSNTVLDYTMLKEAPDGRKLKTRVKDKDTGASYEQYGHCSDANDYLLCEVFRNDMEYYESGGVERRETILGRFMKKFNR